MDPLSAIGLVSSVITFIDFGYEVISAAREVHASVTGTTAANDHVEFLNIRMEAVAKDLAASKLRSGGISTDKRRLLELADNCLVLSGDLKRLLGNLKANNPNSKRQVIRAVVRNWRGKEKKKDLEDRLNQCRQQLHLQLSHTTRLESISRLSEIAQTGKCHEQELSSLNQQVAILRDAVAGIKSHCKLQDEAQAVLDLSDLALSKVLQNSILEALRFDDMDSRFENVEEAHFQTFTWLLDDKASSPLTIPTVETDDLWSEYMLDHMDEENPLRSKIREDFTSWLSTGRGVFHISGKPGAGKSTLMKYLVESDEVKKHLNIWADGKELVLASFFFWRHGTDLQKSLRGLLRSLLHSVLDQQPDLVRLAFPEQWEAGTNSQGKTIHFRQSDIQKAFIALTKTPEVYSRHKFAFFVDGLDEFEGHDDTLVKTLFEWARSGHENIKICVSSRELPIFQQRFLKCPKFRLHEVTRHDIFYFVFDVLQNNEDIKLVSEPRDVAELVNLLVLRAEGVFLWVSLALRLVERGLVLEESIEDLKTSIDVLPTDLEKLFRVIFDSIRTEPDAAKRRKAMRMLSLAVDEHEVNRCRHHLLLTHLSFMDDYDRSPDFASHLRIGQNTTDLGIRLSRCQKQIAGGCRGFLSIRFNTPLSPYDVFRMEAVTLAHRSLIEFFQLPEIQKCIEEHSKGFDRLHFYCQSLIAELTLYPLNSPETVSQEDESETSLIHAPSPRYEYFFGRDENDPYEFRTSRHWFPEDIARLISFYYDVQNPDPSTLLSALGQLSQLAKTEADSTPQFSDAYFCTWRRDSTGVWNTAVPSEPTRCHPSAFIVLTAVSLGLYEFWPAEILENDLREAILKGIAMQMVQYVLTTRTDIFEIKTPFERMLQSLATCLEHGTSANSFLGGFELYVPVSVWQNLVWSTVVELNLGASPVPVWLIFLLYGADQSFTLTFEQSCNFSEEDKSEKLVSATSHWGHGKHEVHSPIHIRGDHGGILDLAKGQNWSVSLRDITYFWFPLHAEKFRRIYQLYDSADLPKEELNDLKRELGFDLAFWRTQVWDIPQPLFRSWEGESEITKRPGYEESSILDVIQQA